MPVDDLLRRFDKFLHRFPGYLGWQGGGLEAIHADWPAYPYQRGANGAIESLACFPRGTRFVKIDAIEFAVLFAALPVVDSQDLFSDRNMHVSVWWDDLVELAMNGFVSGIISSREQVTRYWIKMAPIVPGMPKPVLHEYSNAIDWDSAIDESGLCVTDEGHAFLHQHSADIVGTIDPTLFAQVMPLVVVGRHDAAVRDAFIVLESALRSVAAWPDGYGLKLVARAVESMRTRFRVPEGLLRSLNAELRAVFKFMRNDYAHNLVDASAEQGAAILTRVSRIIELLRAITAAAPGI